MSLKDIKDKFKHVPTDVVGIDFGSAATKMVRLRKAGDSIFLVGTEIGPAAVFENSSLSTQIPARMQARYVSIALSSGGCNAKLLTFPGAVDENFERGLAKNLGLAEQAEDRVAYQIITEGTGRTEARVLAASIPESIVAPVMRCFETGHPAPCSVELSPLATLTAFEAGSVMDESETAGLLDFGTTSSLLSIFHKKTLVMIRKFDFGVRKLIDRVTSALHIDFDTALNILSDDAFDISEMIAEMMGPFSSQLIVSRDFAERRDNCSIKHLYFTGGIAASKAALHELERTMGVGFSLFNPFEIPVLQPESPDAIPVADPWRYSAALGAALGTLQERP